jgi:uncharacterized protein YceK
MKTSLVVLVILLSGCAHVVQHPAARESAPESTVEDVKSLTEIPLALAKSGNRRTLVVLDIDDTLLTSRTSYGSERWYEWQRGLPDSAPGKVPCLFDVIALNFEAGTQQATQPQEGPQTVNAIRNDMLLLSSRNAMYRGATLRELQRAGYQLPPMLGARAEGLLYRWRKDATSRESNVSYDSGVMLLGGQDKGLMLLDLMDKLDLEYDRVILVDDGIKNINAMKAALEPAGIDFLGMHYTRLDKTMSQDDIAAGIAGWTAVREMWRTVFPERIAELEAGHCNY